MNALVPPWQPLHKLRNPPILLRESPVCDRPAPQQQASAVRQSRAVSCPPESGQQSERFRAKPWFLLLSLIRVIKHNVDGRPCQVFRTKRTSVLWNSFVLPPFRIVSLRLFASGKSRTPPRKQCH